MYIYIYIYSNIFAKYIIEVRGYPYGNILPACDGTWVGGGRRVRPPPSPPGGRGLPKLVEINGNLNYQELVFLVRRMLPHPVGVFCGPPRLPSGHIAQKS